MCGRFTQQMSWHELHELYNLSPSQAPLNLRPRYNGAPTQTFAICCFDEELGRQVKMFRWGLIPFWSKDTKIASRLINARSETVNAKPSFRNAFRQRRCVVPADGWFEWKRDGKTKQPYFLSRADNLPVSFAGIWERWGQGDQALFTFSIITKDSAPPLSNVHHRQPVLMRRASICDWLNPQTPASVLSDMMSQDSHGEFALRKVSTLVNSVRNDVAEILEPLENARQ